MSRSSAIMFLSISTTASILVAIAAKSSDSLSDMQPIGGVVLIIMIVIFSMFWSTDRVIEAINSLKDEREDSAIQIVSSRIISMVPPLSDGDGDSICYFVASERDPTTVKIGITKDMRGRMRGLQTGSPDKLILLAAIPGKKSTETFIHDMFRDRRVSGEWFALDAILANVIFEARKRYVWNDTVRNVLGNELWGELNNLPPDYDEWLDADWEVVDEIDEY